VLDEVSTAIHGGAAAVNVKLTGASSGPRRERPSIRRLVQRLVGRYNATKRTEFNGKYAVTLLDRLHFISFADSVHVVRLPIVQ